jgi:cytidylate kinase
VAQRLGWLFLDTGALYRAVAYAVLQRGIAPDDDRSVASFAKTLHPRVDLNPGVPLGYSIYIDGRKLGEELFAPAVSQAVSPIAANAAVRAALIAAQRDFADDRNVVMAGRDIGSVVLPNAGLKFFLTASLDARVDRRLKELHARGIPIDRPVLREEIERRDARDRTRAASPLVKAADAVELDTSALAVEEVVDAVLAAVRGALAE